MIKIITSKDNHRVKFACSLKENKYREKHQMFLGETFKSLEMAIKANRVVEAFSTEYLNIPDEITQNIVSEDVLKKISTNVNPEGVVFIAKMVDVEVKDPTRVLYLDEITDPGNMGTLIRTALAFSYDLVVTSKKCVSIYNEKVVNSSKGAIFAIPVRQGELKEFNGYQIIVTSLGKDSIPLSDLHIREKSVLVLGNESRGVSVESKRMATDIVNIPINNIDSLNVSVAGGILMNIIH